MDHTDQPSSPAPQGGPGISSVEADQLRRRLAQAQSELENTRRELDAIRNSTIWRATLLIRGPIMLALRLRNAGLAPSGQTARAGGRYAKACEWWREVRAYGWGYFSRAISYEKNPAPGSGSHDRNDYAAWTTRSGSNGKASDVEVPDRGPLLSVVVPVYRPPLDLLQEAIASVFQQTYTRWELCIADDASGNPALRDYLQNLAAQHANIKVALREQNGHISACTNSALELASGEYIVLLDQDDLLPAYALTTVAQTIASHPDAGIIFSDEDRIDETGTEKLGAYFKPDFNYDLFLGQNLVSHLGVYRRDLVTKVGGFRVGLEGSQDWDLALRVLEQCQPHQIVHIPQVLYHWRAIQGSTALAQSEKTYTSTAARKAIEDHLARTNVDAEVLPSTHLPAFNRVRYALPKEQRTCTLVVSFDYPAEQLKSMLTLLLNSPGDILCEVLVASSQGLTAEQLLDSNLQGSVPLEVVAVPRNSSPAERLNRLLPLATGHFVAVHTAPIINASNEWLDELCRIAGQLRTGFVAPCIVDGAGLEDIFDHGGILFTDDMRAVHAHKGLFTYMTGYAGRAILQQSFVALSPALLVIRRSLVASINPFATDFGGRLDLIDKCLELHKQGHSNIWTPDVEIRFNDLKFAGKANVLTELGPFGTRRRAWISKWGRRPADPGYNPNLSPDGDFSLNWLA